MAFLIGKSEVCRSWEAGAATVTTVRARSPAAPVIVSGSARNLQIERSGFDGAWNKGKGGNGYLRGSRVWDSLWACNLSRNLRHFTFRWSASGNVALGNGLDSDLNLHGGWEHDNLFEQNAVRIPWEHRSASCTTNCGGEGGEMGDGTWYPIRWAVGAKAAKWSGSSGPQNVFFNNTLIKRETLDGSYEPCGPYGTQSRTAFEFGSDDGDPRLFCQLSQGGRAIPDWGQPGEAGLHRAGSGVPCDEPAVPVPVRLTSSPAATAIGVFTGGRHDAQRHGARRGPHC